MEIGDDIIVTVVSVDRGMVRILFDAPRNVRVDRSEIADRIRKQAAGDANGNMAEVVP